MSITSAAIAEQLFSTNATNRVADDATKRRRLSRRTERDVQLRAAIAGVEAALVRLAVIVIRERVDARARVVDPLRVHVVGRRGVVEGRIRIVGVQGAAAVEGGAPFGL